MKARDLLVCCFMAAAPLAYAAPVYAADPEVEARERFDRAVKLYDEGNYDAALVEFQRAAALRPSYKLFYNMGQVQVARSDYASALVAYRQYLTQGGDKIPEPRRAQVHEEMKRLEQRVARLDVETDLPGAEVFIEDVSVGKTPLPEPILVNAGSRRVQVRHPEHAPQSRVVSLAGAVQERVRFTLASGDRADALADSAGEQTAPSRAASPPPAPADPSSRAGSSGLWIGWSVTGALAAGAVVTGVIALSKNSDLDERRDQFVRSQDELETDAKRVRTLAIVADGLGIAALAAGGVTLWLTLTSDDAEGGAAAPSTAHRRLRVGVGPTGAVLRGSF